MTGESETSRSLDRAFLAALLLTDSAEIAETVMLDAIDLLKFDFISGDGLLLETVKSAIRRRRAYLTDQLVEASSLLPLEPRRVLLLAPTCRHCFLLRSFLGVTPEVCSLMLDLSVQEVDDALRTGILELPLVEGCGSARFESSRFTRDRKAGFLHELQ